MNVCSIQHPMAIEGRAKMHWPHASLPGMSRAYQLAHGRPPCRPLVPLPAYGGQRNQGDVGV